MRVKIDSHDHDNHQVKLGFTVKASTTVGNSTADLAKKNKGSVASITKVVEVFNLKTMMTWMMSWMTSWMMI